MKKSEIENAYNPKQRMSTSKPLAFHLYTIWLITVNDLKSIVLPETVFGIFSALSGPLLTTNQSPSISEILGRLPHVLLWNWLNLLIFDIANQRLPESVQEDSINKSWRPIPSKRLSPDDARRLLLAAIPLVILCVFFLGGMTETLSMIALTWMYNDLAGADENYIVRNIINAIGFVCYSSGATVVAAGYGKHELNGQSIAWLTVVGLIVFTTLQMQDMADVEGDKARGRRTLPLVHGDAMARWSIAIPVIGWSVFCPRFWQATLIGYILPVVIGMLLSIRILTLRSIAADRLTWKVWCAWTTVLYLIPAFQYMIYLA